MSHSQTYDAIVLRTYDIGEADRFCILLTRERGRLTARANAVRRLTSAMGGSLLPFHHVTVQLKEWREGNFIVAGADGSKIVALQHRSLAWFTQAQQGIELLLSLTEDGEPLPEVFAATLEFLMLCGDTHAAVLHAYTVRLLHLLGLLPERSSIHESFGLESDDHLFLEHARSSRFTELPHAHSLSHIERLCHFYMADQLRLPLRAAGVSMGMRT